MQNKKVVFVVNVDWFFISHRLPIALQAIKEGFEVHLICNDTGKLQALSEYGLHTHSLNFSRRGGTLLNEIKTLIMLRKLVKNINPDILHVVTIQPVIYSGLILHSLKNKPYFVVAISGLGYVFTAQNLRAKLTKFIASILYKLALAHKSKTVIFQNTNDEKILSSVTHLSESEKVLIKGSGVDLTTYKYTKEPDSTTIKIIMACRLLKEKGVYEYIKAAKIVKSQYTNAEFLLAGTPDDGNPNSVSQSELDSWGNSGIVTLLGHCDDIPKCFMESHIVTLPSYYGEGVPKVLLEAAACGRPVVTTDNPGCRDAIISDVTGKLVPIQDPMTLAQAFILLISDAKLREDMGRSARQYAEKEFDVKSVVQKHIDIYMNGLGKN